VSPLPAIVGVFGKAWLRLQHNAVFSPVGSHFVPEPSYPWQSGSCHASSSAWRPKWNTEDVVLFCRSKYAWLLPSVKCARQKLYHQYLVRKCRHSSSQSVLGSLPGFSACKLWFVSLIILPRYEEVHLSVSNVTYLAPVSKCWVMVLWKFVE